MDERTKRSIGDYVGIFVCSLTIVFIGWATGVLSFTKVKDKGDLTVDTAMVKTDGGVHGLTYITDDFKLLGVQQVSDGVVFFHYIDNKKKGWSNPIYYRVVKRGEKIYKEWKFLGLIHDEEKNDLYIFQVPKPEEE